MNILHCVYSWYVACCLNLAIAFIASASARSALSWPVLLCIAAMLGPVLTRCHISGTVPARQCSNMFLRPSLSQSQSGDCCNAVSCSAAWHSVMTCHVSRAGWVTQHCWGTTYHRTRCRGEDDDDPQICAAIGVLKTFSCFLNIPNINIFRTWQSSEQSSGVWPGPGCSSGPLNGTCESNVDWEESWNFVTLQISIPRILDGYQCRCHLHPATMHHQSPSIKYRAFQTHGGWDEDMKTSGGQGVIISNPISSWSPHHHHQLPIAMKMELNVPGT